MPTTSIVIGFLLIALGLGGYFGTGTASLTALIPAAFGLVLAGLGVIARNEAKRKMAMHIAAAVALVGFIACVPGMLKVPALLSHQTVARPAAVISQTIMGVITAIFIVLAVKSFRDARRHRKAN